MIGIWARYWNARMLLLGSVLVGLWLSPSVASAATGTFTRLSAQSLIASIGGVAAPLPGGDVLIAGGVDNDGNSGDLSNAELFDPSTGNFTALPRQMTTGRFWGMAAPLPGGRVLIAGGLGDTGYLSSAEEFDPNTGSFTALPNAMTTARWGAVAAPLPDGDVLIVGGQDGAPGLSALSSAELFDPSTGTFTALPAQLKLGIWYSVAAPLPGGDVLVAGGEAGGDVAQVFDPWTATFTQLPGSLATSRQSAVAAPLPGGDVLIAGGMATLGPAGFYSASAELFDPSTGQSTALPNSMTVARLGAVAAPLPDGQVLIADGYSGQADALFESSAELFTPSPEPPSTGGRTRRPWTASFSGGANTLSAVSCASRWREIGPPRLPGSLCVAVGGSASLQSIAWSGAGAPPATSPAEPITPSSSANTNPPSLVGISCVPKGPGVQCVAVGDRWTAGAGGAEVKVPLIEQWDGQHWTMPAQSEPAGAVTADLRGVSCVISGECVAVGGAQGSTLAFTPVIERFDGRSWQVQPPPSLPGPLTAVSCASADACMAVGASGTIVRWNGAAWMDASAGSAADAELYGVSCPSTTYCVAVGTTGIGAVAETWNGSRWSPQPVPRTTGLNSIFESVSCSTTSNCVAVGKTCLDATPFCDQSAPLSEQWTGDQWRVVSTPTGSDAGVDTFFSSVSCRKLIGCVGVGTWNSRGAGVWARTPIHNSAVSVSDVQVSQTGVLRFRAKVPEPGTLDVMETAWDSALARAAVELQPAPHRFVFARGTIPVNASRTITGVVRPYPVGRRLLAHHRHPVTLRVWVSFTPKGGYAQTVGFYRVALRPN